MASDCQVTISTGDLLEVKGVDYSMPDRSLTRLLTKTNKLKATVGQAHKGWTLAAVASASKNVDPTPARSALRDRISRGNLDAQHDIQQKFAFYRKPLVMNVTFTSTPCRSSTVRQRFVNTRVVRQRFVNDT